MKKKYEYVEGYVCDKSINTYLEFCKVNKVDPMDEEVMKDFKTLQKEYKENLEKAKVVKVKDLAKDYLEIEIKPDKVEEIKEGLQAFLEIIRILYSEEED